ncbi:MAG: amidohydrolase family protein [Oscillospiraceae bacterium]|jgi:predicted TIM-barrel fold metal-dependent hydrolase|nr:amidohydrolase family protein [Oscillospiraceae bacterium]
MKIDFHVHAFADKIAKRAIDNLLEHTDTPNITDGTFSDTIEKLKARGIDKAVFLGIATKPTQQTVLNDWAKFVIDEGWYAFGSIHPLAEDSLAELERIKTLGLYGIKLHPEYQNFFADDEKMFPVYQKCSDLKLPITFHCGYDPISGEQIRCMPKMLAKISDIFPDLTIIAAHLGGTKEIGETLEYLAGKDGNIYFDTAIVPYYMGFLDIEKIIKKHGTDRILFASDCPWGDPLYISNIFDMLNFTTEEKENIYYKNALRVLQCDNK